MSAPPSLVLVFEGEGEREALPILVTRIAASLDPPLRPKIAGLYRKRRAELAQPQHLADTVQLCVQQCGKDVRILVLLDADDDCPARLGPQLQACAREARSDVSCAVVLASREYETWFLYAAESLRGWVDPDSGHAIPDDFVTPSKAEEIRGAKERIVKAVDPGPRRTFSYKEAKHQVALTRRMDLGQARGSDSFDKLFREVCRLLGREAPPKEGGEGTGGE